MSKLNEEITLLQGRVKLLERLTNISWVLMAAGYITGYHTWGDCLLTAAICLLIYRTVVKKKLKRQELLANEVEARTQEIRSERDAVQEESDKLAAALQALAEAQDELVRQERMATVGQLTKGLVDRILNPLNYINNFASLTTGLTKELRTNLSEVEGKIPKETYEDSSDLLDMMDSNLTKISEHGFNTVRIVKAMEELLKERKGNLTLTNINNLCRIAVDKLRKEYESDIARRQIRITFAPLNLGLMMEVNVEQLGKVLSNLLRNAIYALLKKQGTFDPEIRFALSLEEERLHIAIRDNGTGIDESLKEKIFAPFFTTKPTSEAAGIGLYLCREIIQDHRGTIEVESVKGEYTEFHLSIPVYQPKTETQTTEED